ncbi:MAG: hypothetical protein ACI4OR_04620 [Alphaproteobacteria bacterium]
MFFRIKKSKTLRSLLGAAALFSAGVPQMAQAAPKSSPKITQSARTAADVLTAEYMPICAELEGNAPYCYRDKNVLTTGAGVHLKDYAGLGQLEAVKLTLKKGTVFNLKDFSRLRRMADADWKNPKTAALYPEVVKTQKIKLEKATGDFPLGTDKTWQKEQLVLVPSTVLKKINKAGADFCVNKACEYHPNLFQLSPSARLVVVDLIYNLGHNKYFDTYPKFKAAVQKQNLKAMKEQCQTKNKRRDAIRECLIDAALLAKTNPKMTRENLLKQIRQPVVAKNPKLAPALEKTLWSKLDAVSARTFDWQKQQTLAWRFLQNHVALKK